jgi:MFS family permease
MLGGLGLMAIAFAVIAATITAHSMVLLILCLGSYGIGAAVFFPANLARLLDLTGPEAYGIIGAVQRMAINLGIAVDAAVVGVFLMHGAHAERVASLSGARTSWVFGAMTLLLAMGGLRLSYVSPTGQDRAP